MLLCVFIPYLFFYMKFLGVIFSILFLLSCSSTKNSTEYFLMRSESGKKPYYYADVYGLIMIQKHYQEARQFVGNLAAVKENDKWGFINKDGVEVIPCMYDWVSSFGEFGFDKNVAVIKNGTDKYKIPMFTPCYTALINVCGKVISKRYGFIYPIENGLSIVNNGMEFYNVGRELSASKDGLWGCIDKRGKEIIPCKYELMYPFRENITFVRINGLWGCIDKRGKEIIPCKYDGVIYKSLIQKINTFDNENFKFNMLEEYEKDVIYMYLKDNIFLFDKKGREI